MLTGPGPGTVTTSSPRRRLRGAAAGLVAPAAGAVVGACGPAPAAQPAVAPPVSGTIVATYPISRMEEVTYGKLFRLAEERHPVLKIDGARAAGPSSCRLPPPPRSTVRKPEAILRKPELPSG
jgi:hypothetical protein